MLNDNLAFLCSWPRSGDDYVVTSADMLSSVENMSKNSTPRADYQNIGGNDTLVCVPCWLMEHFQSRWQHLTILLPQSSLTSFPVINKLSNSIVHREGAQLISRKHLQKKYLVNSCKPKSYLGGKEGWRRCPDWDYWQVRVTTLHTWSIITPIFDRFTAGKVSRQGRRPQSHDSVRYLWRR